MNDDHQRVDEKERVNGLFAWILAQATLCSWIAWWDEAVHYTLSLVSHEYARFFVLDPRYAGARAELQRGFLVKTEVEGVIEFRLRRSHVRHRIDGPAFVAAGGEKWYFNGRVHRIGGPAAISSRREEWVEHDRRHRIGGPAVTTKLPVYCPHDNIYRQTGCCAKLFEQWYENNQLHRIGGPAIKIGDHEEWYEHNQRHRIDGPAVTRHNCEEWWIHGELVLRRYVLPRRT